MVITDREIEYDPDAICDGCGHKGAYDFMGDHLCSECAQEVIVDDEDYEYEEN